jgi:hypothetical protein
MTTELEPGWCATTNRRCEDIRAEIGRLRADLSQMRAFAKMMSKDNWLDLSLRIQRQGVDGQTTK